MYQFLLIAEQQADDTLIDAEIVAGLFVVTEGGVRRDSFEEREDAENYAAQLRSKSHQRILVLPRIAG